MKIADWLEATQDKRPHQCMSVRPVQHYDDLSEDGSNDFVVTMIVGNKQVAYRVDLATALEIDSWINHGLRLAVANGKPVSIYTARPEQEHETNAR